MEGKAHVHKTVLTPLDHFTAAVSLDTLKQDMPVVVSCELYANIIAHKIIISHLHWILCSLNLNDTWKTAAFCIVIDFRYQWMPIKWRKRTMCTDMYQHHWIIPVQLSAWIHCVWIYLQWYAIDDFHYCFSRIMFRSFSEWQKTSVLMCCHIYTSCCFPLH